MSLPPRSEIPVVILCGGQGTRIREVSESLPKPMVDVGGRPILWHIMKLYGAHGFRRFVLCLGYKGWEVKKFFLDYRAHVSDLTLQLGNGHEITYHDSKSEENWEITFAETGLNSGTGARLRLARKYLDGPVAMVTYGDGLGAVDLGALLKHHDESDRLGTVTSVHPTSRYGEMEVEGPQVLAFNEKPTHVAGWVSGGFFVFGRSFFDDYLDDDPQLLLELDPLGKLARDGELAMFPHEGFWMGMDTFRDYTELNRLWDSGEAPWRAWNGEGDHR
jgi:glucose-1-phosphate cytidylyltransferase